MSAKWLDDLIEAMAAGDEVRAMGILNAHRNAAEMVEFLEHYCDRANVPLTEMAEAFDRCLAALSPPRSEARRVRH